MKKYSKFLYVVFALSAVGGVMMMYARVRRADSDRKFEYILKNARLAVVMFYEGGKSDKGLSVNMDRVKDVFESLGNRGRYEDAEIVFIKVNIDKRNLVSLAEEYGITEYPSFILFDEDEVISNSYGSPIMLTGFVSRSELKKFIEDNLESRIGEILKQKDELTKRRREELSVSWVPYYYPYDYYYPYWDFYGRRPSYSPGIGFSFGAHARYSPHRHQRYHGRYRRGYRRHR